MKTFYSFLAVTLFSVMLVACGGNGKVDKQALIKQRASEYAIEFDQAIGDDDCEKQFEIWDRIDEYKKDLTDAEKQIFDSAYEVKIEELIEARGL